MADVAARLEQSRKELLDHGLRHPMISFTTKNRIDVIDEVAVEIFRILVDAQKSMTFQPIPQQAPQDGDALVDPDDVDWSAVFGADDEDNRRHTDTKLQTKLNPEDLTKRLVRLELDARTYIEEQGVNILYLALGFIHWFEDASSDRERRAPLFLLPVALKRGTVRENFTLEYTGEEFGYNLSFSERLKAEHGFTLPDLEVTEAEELEAYQREVAGIARLARWRIEPNEIALSFFSFGKFLMHRDLDADAWPEGARPEDHPVLQALLSDGFRDTAPMLAEDAHVDDIADIDDLHQVVDADSSQTMAILDIMAGRNLVVQGPPGTGKSQTITNVIAEAVGQGKKVLFVSEKMAALEVVKRRLDQVNLGVAALELHSHKANKKAVLAELKKTLDLTSPQATTTADDVELLKQIKARLNAYCDAANRPILNTRLTPVELIGRLRQMGDDVGRLPRFDFAPMRDWNDATFNAHRYRAEQLAERLGETGTPSRNPFWGSRLMTVLPSEIDGLREALAELRAQCERLRAESAALAARLEMGPPPGPLEVGPLCRAALRAVEAPHVRGLHLTSGDWQARHEDVAKLIDAGERIARIRAARAGQLIEEAWQQELLTERQHYANHGAKWWRGLIGDFKRARARLQGLCAQALPKASSDCLALIDDILEVRRATLVYNELEPMGRALFGAQWQRQQSDWEVLRQIADWVVDTYRKVGEGALSKGLLQFLEGAPSLDGLAQDAEAAIAHIKRLREGWEQLVKRLDYPNPEPTAEGATAGHFAHPFAQQLARLDDWIGAFPQGLLELTKYTAAAHELETNGLDFVLADAAQWERPAHDFPRAFVASWYQGLLDAAFRERTELARFDSLIHEREIERFRELDTLLFRHNQIRLVQKHWQELPNASAGGEVNLLNRQFNLKRKHLPIRKLMEQAGRAIQALKPVFMMSPMSIATFLPRGGMQFDLVVFDEASQVQPVDAFGAILRGTQTVVVGDSRQLPPSNFFAAALNVEADDDDEGGTGDLESILGLFLASGAPQRMLRWHYRSRHESLIALSNQEFYDNKLVIFPSPGANPAARGLVFNYLPHTTYDRGGSRSNRDEAEAVARAVMDHAREHPALTLGVVAFSVAQRDAIQFAVERLRRGNSSYEDFFQSYPEEPFFVKNLENVQGDERDVILISVGYGKTAEGYMAHSFGPLNADGGERRLNVLITRARLKCEVFANFTADDIDLARTQARGVVSLKRYLAYAKDGILQTALGSLGALESPFEEEVAKALVNLGHRVESQVGCAGFRIDLGINDPERPGRYLLGIECDGATYHSSRSARDRDRLRQQVLEGLGWRIHRIWSTDWFRNEATTLKKVQTAIELATEHWRAVDRGERTHAQPPKAAHKTEIPRADDELVEHNGARGVPYQRAAITVSLGKLGLHELGAVKLARLVEQIVAVEGPVHRDVVMSRITAAAGVGRAGSRIRDAIDGGIAMARRDGTVVERGDFLSKAGDTEVRIRDRSDLETSERKSEWISDEEIAAALVHAVTEAFSMAPEEAGANAMAMLGFQRRTKELQERLQGIVEGLIEKGVLEEGGDGWIRVGLSN